MEVKECDKGERRWRGVVVRRVKVSFCIFTAAWNKVKERIVSEEAEGDKRREEVRGRYGREV